MDRLQWLAQARIASPDDFFSQVAPWLVGLLAVVMAGGIVIYFIRRMLRADHGAPIEGFALEDLRQMHRRGELSDEEFEKARITLIGRITATEAGDDSKNEPPTTDLNDSTNKTEPDDVR